METMLNLRKKLAIFFRIYYINTSNKKMEDKMIINKVLNNNVVIVFNEKNEEIIVMGKGIGYQKSKGDFFEDNPNNKVFKIVNEDILGKFQELLFHIPNDFMKICVEIIELAENKLNKKLNETIYISLSDHLYSAFLRMKDGVSIKNNILWEIKRFYSSEFEIGERAIEIIERRTGIKLAEDEAGFIAFHLINAQLNKGTQMVYDVTKMIHEILNTVKYHFNIKIDEKSVFYYRFIMHLKFFAQRLFSNETYFGENDGELLAIIQDKYKSAFECVIKISKFIQKKYNYKLSDDEIVYLTIHISKLISKVSK